MIEATAVDHVASLPVGQAVHALLQEWVNAGAHSSQTLARMGEVAVRFARRLEATGTACFGDATGEECERFIVARTKYGEPPTPATQHFRRTTIRTLFRTMRNLGAEVGDPTLDIVLPPRGQQPARPLTDDEIVLCRTAVFTRSRGRERAASALALAEATAHTAEIPRVTVADLDDPGAPTAVWLTGTSRCEPRSGWLTSWGAQVVGRRAITTSGSLTYAGNAGPGSISPHAASCGLISGILDSAGLAAEPDVRPASIRNWAGRRLFDDGLRIEEVARRLGSRSLDATAAAIGLEWR